MNEFLRTILYLPEQQSTIARDLDGLHYFVILVTMAGAVFVALMTAYFLFKYRASTHRGESRPPATDRLHTRGGMPIWIEIAIIVGLLGLFVMWWVLGFRLYVRTQRVPDDAMEVYVTAKKWMWSFGYPDGSGSQSVAYVPVNRPVKLIMTSRDVIHSFFVPEFRVKQDLVPGRVTIAWFEARSPGVYEILCTEYCGVGHSEMRGQVVVLSEEDYKLRMEEPARFEVEGTATYIPRDNKVREQDVTMAEMGELAANRHGCLRCHTVDGTPHIGPTWARVYGSKIMLSDGETLVVDEAYLTESMMRPLAKLRSGFPPLMPTYQGRLTAAESAAIVEYIKSLRSVPYPPAPAAAPIVAPTTGQEEQP